jgi:hypothetical protein
MPEGRPLQDVAQDFAAELADTVSRFLDRECSFTSTAISNGRFVVADKDGDGIPLHINGEQLLVLSVDIRCHWDSRETYLAVEQSSFKVFAGSQSGEPLFRYEFLRDPQNANVPCAHLQIGAHRDEFTHALGYGGSSRRSRKRAGIPPGKAPRIVDVHFPLGGPRFRPCLEDILAMTREEFGIDTAKGWQKVVNEGRRRWRLIQLASAVRDCPEEAARVLRELDYTVERFPSSAASGNRARLIQP